MENSDTQAAAELDIVIPVYNEAETIAATLAAVALHAPTSHRVIQLQNVSDKHVTDD